MPNNSNFQQLIQGANGPLPPVNGGTSLGPNAIPALTTEAAARGLTNDRTPTEAATTSTPAAKSNPNDGILNPLRSIQTLNIPDSAPEINAQADKERAMADDIMKRMGLNENAMAPHH
jgi:hypothetical protein